MKRLFVLFLIILGLLPSQALAQGNAPTDDPALAKVEQAVRDKLKAKGRADYWIIFGQQADLSAATSIAD